MMDIPSPTTATGDGFTMTLYKRGAERHEKTRHPLHFGVFHELRTPEATLHFNLNHEILRAQGHSANWPSELEWLKRTRGNDWVYYSTGGYAGTYETIGENLLTAPISFRIPTPYNEVVKATGEYYLPNVTYPSNAVLGHDPFANAAVQDLIANWPTIVERVWATATDLPVAHQDALHQVRQKTPEALQAAAKQFAAIAGGRVSVLPPDARHVDYNILPLTVADGCRYKCRFCTIKNRKPFAPRSQKEISDQLGALRDCCGQDLVNTNAVFFGEHDALSAPAEILEYAAATARETLQPETSFMQGWNCFCFGSVDGLLEASDRFFHRLNALGATVYINIGFESADQETLDTIGKPLGVEQVEAAFARMLDLNARFANIEITGNFLMDDQLPSGHYPSFLRLVRESISAPKGKGTIYLSPLMHSNPSSKMLFTFNQLKTLSRLPTYLYLIQRL